MTIVWVVLLTIVTSVLTNLAIEVYYQRRAQNVVGEHDLADQPSHRAKG